VNWAVAGALGFSLALDAFAVSCAIPLYAPGVGLAGALRAAGAFGLFQTVMPLLGFWLAGNFLDVIEPVDHWVAFFLLAFVGGHMIFEGISALRATEAARKAMRRKLSGDPTRGSLLFLLALGTSIDALAVGVSFVGLELHVYGTAAVIGGITFALSLFGVLGAGRLSRNMGDGRCEILGGVILVLLGVKILLQGLFF